MGSSPTPGTHYNRFLSRRVSLAWQSFLRRTRDGGDHSQGRRASVRSDSPSDSQGISEDEIRHAAIERGIAPGALDAALRGSAESGPQRFNWWGGLTRYEAERIFDGTIRDEAWENILADLRQTFEENGTVERRARPTSGPQPGAEWITRRSPCGLPETQLASRQPVPLGARPPCGTRQCPSPCLWWLVYLPRLVGQ